MIQCETGVDGELGALVRMHRVARGMTQVELARAARMTPAQLEGYETGVNRLSVPRLMALCRALGHSAPAMLSELERRLEFGEAAVVEAQPGIDFLASNRGRQLVRALAACDRPDLIDAISDLVTAATLARRDVAVPKTRAGLGA